MKSRSSLGSKIIDWIIAWCIRYERTFREMGSVGSFFTYRLYVVLGAVYLALLIIPWDWFYQFRLIRAYCQLAVELVPAITDYAKSQGSYQYEHYLVALCVIYTSGFIGGVFLLIKINWSVVIFPQFGRLHAMINHVPGLALVLLVSIGILFSTSASEGFSDLITTESGLYLFMLGLWWFAWFSSLIIIHSFARFFPGRKRA